MRGLDYSFSRPNLAEVKAAGYDFVCRYLSNGSAKDITAQEVQDIKNHGLALALVWESTANRSLSGHQAGVDDARAAQAEAVAVGCSDIGAIYFAVDFDPSLADLLNVVEYIRGAATILGKDRTGVYGGIAVVNRCLNEGVCSFAWQTYAWSGGSWDSRVQIRQTSNGQVVGGGAVDIDESMVDNYGQWPASQPHITNTPVMANDIDFVVKNKINEFLIEGSPMCYQIFAVPDTDFFLNTLHDSFDNVRHLPSDWPLDPKDWANERNNLQPKLDALTTLYTQVKQQLSASDASLSAANATIATLQQDKQDLTEELTKAQVVPSLPTITIRPVDSINTPKTPPVIAPAPQSNDLVSIIARFISKYF
jgi:hypothetical protein